MWKIMHFKVGQVIQKLKKLLINRNQRIKNLFVLIAKKTHIKSFTDIDKRMVSQQEQQELLSDKCGLTRSAL